MRRALSERLLADLAEVWEEHGKEMLTKLAVTDPGKLAQIAYGLLPRDVFISVEQKTPGNLEPEAWATLRRVLDLIEACKVEGDPQAVFAAIEQNLPAWLAKPVLDASNEVGTPRPMGHGPKGGAVGARVAGES
jgi:hypothetical protein